VLELTAPGPQQVQYRSAGQAAQATHVLLHGIGSASASWAEQLSAARDRTDGRLLAWDAPGYGQSAPVLPASPQPADYGERVWQWLDALGERQPVVLVGHSLGALMAGAAARLQPGRARALVLLAPAAGYGDAPAAEREDKLNKRLQSLQRLGPEGMARERAAAMLSPHASSAQVEAVRANMAQVNPEGYTQAARMLAQGVLLRELAGLRCPVTVACGSLDAITVPSACQAVADGLGVPLLDLGTVGHACPLEGAAAVNRLLGLSAKEAA
jgi:pimeloyl-ACP methyl ester carboxylesterase